jgi:simple sugar transport system permease protein
VNTKLSNNLTLFCILIVITGIMTAFLPSQFMTLRNFRSMGLQFPEYGLLALANMMAMITGGIDLSVVSIASLSGVVSASLLSQYATVGMPVGAVIVLSILIALAVSALCGLLNGVIIAYARVPAIIATLGTQGLFLGISIIITKGHGIGGFPPAFLFIGNGSILGMPTQFVIFVVIALLIGLVLTRTPQGFSMLMYGSSAQVSRFSGISNEMVLIKTYLLTGLLSGVASLVIISGVNSIRPGYGADYLLLSILIAILGGTDPAGGFGTVLGLTLAIFIMQVLQSGLNILSFSPFMKKFIWGLLLVAVMVFHYYRRMYALRRAVRKSAATPPAAQSA